MAKKPYNAKYKTKRTKKTNRRKLLLYGTIIIALISLIAFLIWYFYYLAVVLEVFTFQWL